MKHVTKQKYNSYTYVKINVVLTLNSRGHGTSFESGQPAHLCCLTRLYTVGCSSSYFDLDIPKIDINCSKIKFRQVHCLNLTGEG